MTSVNKFTSMNQPKMQSYSNFQDFIYKHYVNKDDSHPITNTRIADKTGKIKGGSYHISEEEYPVFLKLYHRDVLSKNVDEYITEKQLDADGPIVVDIDLRYDYDVKERQHNKGHISDMIYGYLEELKVIYQFDDSQKFHIYVMEKPSVNVLEDRKVTKDGIHMIIGIQSDRITQRILREKMVKKLSEVWEDLPLKNKNYDDILDEGITIGFTNWQLYGSGKPNNQKYELTYVYEVTFDENDNEFCTVPIQPTLYDIGKNIEKLSVRYKDHPTFFMRNDFLITHNEYKKLYKPGEKNKQQTLQKPNMSQIQLTMRVTIDNILKISNITELDLMKNLFLETLNDNDYELKETYEYVLALPHIYYEFSENGGSQPKWIRVGWALKNVNDKFYSDWNDKLFLIWIIFSAQAKGFRYTDIRDLYSQWSRFEINKQGCLTKRSLMHWVKLDAPEKYKKIREDSVDHAIELTIEGENLGVSPQDRRSKCSGDVGLANVLFQKYKDRFVCTSIKNNDWYTYMNNRWIKNEGGTSLRNNISEVRTLYNIKLQKTTDTIDLNQEHIREIDNTKQPKHTTRSCKIIEIVEKLNNTSARNNIMTEAKHLFYDIKFLDKLDQNPNLLCFNNGVFDFTTKCFRKGLPEDCITLCTNIDYIELDERNHASIIDEVKDFMHKLFYVDKELERYMWDHLASALLGTTVNQTFNMYIGANGANGKSKLTKLMGMILGEYKGDIPTTLITGEKMKIGGTQTEIVQLKGKRYAVMPEPSKGEKMNEGIMKQLTSGDDIIQARGLYSPETISFYPQFKLVCCSNELMVIKSNDGGTWRRVRVIPFLSRFEYNPVDNDPIVPYQFKRDDNLDEKLTKWKEIFMAMLVKRACETNGKVEDCDIVLQESNKYRIKEDHISRFVTEKIMKDPKGKIKKTELNNEFNLWYQISEGNKGGPSPKELHAYMNKYFGNVKNNLWIGVSILYDHKNEQSTINIDDSEGDDVSSEDL